MIPTITRAKEYVDRFFAHNMAAAPVGGRTIKQLPAIPYEDSMPEVLEECVLEINGVYEMAGRKDETILVTDGYLHYNVLPVEGTTFSSSITRNGKQSVQNGDRLSVIAIETQPEDVFVAISIIRQEDKELFNGVKSLYGRALAIHNFYRLFKNYPDKQNYIARQLKGQTYSRFDSSSDIRFGTRQEQVLQYELCKENYPLETQRAIEGMLADPDITRHKVDERLGIISGISPTYFERRPIISREALMKYLDSKYYKQETAKSQLADILISNQKANRRGANILFVGPPGTGKTSLIETIGEVINIPCVYIPLNGMSTPMDLGGSSFRYDNGFLGDIAMGFKTYSTSECLVIFDEFDKVNQNTNEGNPLNVLYRSMLGTHLDSFLDAPISTENTIFAATANCIDDIPKPIIDRFDTVIYVDSYSVEDKIEIAKRHMIPDTLENYNLSSEEIRFTDEAIRTIATRYCEENAGVRDLQHNIRQIVRHAVATCEDEQLKMVIDEKRLPEMLCVTGSQAKVFGFHCSDNFISTKQRR